MAAAYRLFRKDPPESLRSAPGHWTVWSHEYRWSERAIAQDRHQDRLAQAARDRRVIETEGSRTDLALRSFVLAERRLQNVEDVLDKYEEDAKLSTREVTQTKLELVNGKTKPVITKFKAFNGIAYAKLLMSQSDLLYRTINGTTDGHRLPKPEDPGGKKGEAPVTKVEYGWAPPIPEEPKQEEPKDATSTISLSPASSSSTMLDQSGKASRVQ